MLRGRIPGDTVIFNAYLASEIPAVEHLYCGGYEAELAELGARAFIHQVEEHEFGPRWWETTHA